MTDQPHKLKKLPWAPSLKLVYLMYPNISRNNLKTEIHTIVKANRPYWPEGKRISGLYPSEFIELMRVCGPAEGYEITPWMERQLDKKPKL